MEKDEKLYQRIKEIADEQHNGNEPISRADLAYVLQKDGFDCSDGQALNEAVYNAYQQYGQPANMREFLLDNSLQKSLVDVSELDAQLRSGSTELALQTATQTLAETERQIDLARDETADVLKLELAKLANSMVQEMRGDAGIREVQQKANALMENYGRMIDAYRGAEQGVKDNIHDFVAVRSHTNRIFNEYAQALVDIFGDSIKAVAPKLFNFDSIQYLDVSAMQQERVLDFNRLDETCTLLTGEVAANFKQLLDSNQQRLSQTTKGMKLLSAKGGKSGSWALLGANLLLAAFELVDHQIDAADKTVRLQREYGKLTDSVRRDKTQITADLARLATIRKVLNDVYMPRANAFCRYGNQVLNDDLDNLLDAIYSVDGVKELKAKRDELLARIEKLEVQIADHQENIAYFKARISDDEGMLTSQEANYQKAKDEMPKQPWAVSNVVTFGSAKRNYQKKITDWKTKYGNLVDAYEEAKVNTANYKDDLTTHENQLKTDEDEYRSLKAELNKLNQQMLAKLKCTPEQKQKVLKHLNGLLGVLHSAKTISESKLDESLTRTAVIADTDNVEVLPADVQENLKTFVKSLTDSVKTTGEEISSDSAQSVKGGYPAVTTEVATLMNDNASRLEAVGNHTAAKAASLIENWLYLQGESMRSQLKKEVLMKEEERLKTEFQQQMHAIDNQSEALCKILARANTATDKEVLRQALIDLGGDKVQQLSAEDFDALLSGTKQIEI